MTTPTTSETIDFHSTNLNKHTSSNPLQRLLIDRFHATAAELFARTGARQVLDAGCGEGFGIQHVMQTGQPEVVGVDYSMGALHLARQMHPQIHFASTDVTSLPFPDNSFDLVVCMEVLEHIDTPDRGLADLCRVTRRWLLLSVPHEPLFRGANFLRGKNMHAWGNDPGHVNHWSAGGFRQFVERRCTVVEQRQSFPWTLVLCQKR